VIDVGALGKRHRRQAIAALALLRWSPSYDLKGLVPPASNSEGFATVAPMLPRAILFDLDDTILQAYGGQPEAWLSVTAEFASELAPLLPHEITTAIVAFSRAFWLSADRQWRMRPKEARRKVVAGAFAALARAGRPTPSLELAQRLADRFSAYREEQMCLFPDAHQVIDALRASGTRLGLVTNGAGALQRAKIVRFDLVRRFDYIQIEGEHGFGKPEERAYRHAMDALGVDARETWMIGDNLEWEVAAPQRLGIFAIWFDSVGKGLPEGTGVRPDRIIGRLSELLQAADFA
jgi:putative hydrolase of the HAD superfamily